MAPNSKVQLCFIDGSFEELATELATYLNIPSQEVAPLLEENKKDDVRRLMQSLFDLQAFLFSVPYDPDSSCADPNILMCRSYKNLLALLSHSTRFPKEILQQRTTS